MSSLKAKRPLLCLGGRNMNDKKILSYLLTCFVFIAGSFFNLKAVANTTTSVYCYGVKNSGDPLSNKTVKGAWAINPTIQTAYSWSIGNYQYGNYFSVSGNWGNSSYLTGTGGDGGWMNYFRLAADTTLKDQIIAACKAAFLNPKVYASTNTTAPYLNGILYGNYAGTPFNAADVPNLTILPVVSNGLYQYPIIENSKKLSFFSGQMKGINDSFSNKQLSTSQNYFKDTNIYAFSLAANLAYSVPSLPPGSNPSSMAGTIPDDFIPFQVMAPGNPQDLSNKYSYGVALKNDVNKVIIISYKGTDPSNSYDIKADIDLMASNIVDGSVLANYVSSAYNFYKSVKNANSDYKIILTGHSLGAFIATQIAVRTGELARVFSSPSNFLTAKQFNIAAAFASVGYLPLPNVINFARSYDPVVNLSSNPLRSTPVNSTVYYPERANDYNLVNNHLLESYFIPEILYPYSVNASDAKDTMSYLYMYADTIMDYVSDDAILFAGSTASF